MDNMSLIKEKAALFDRLTNAVYETIIRIDFPTGEGEVVMARNLSWGFSTGDRFPFEQTMNRFLRDQALSAETDPRLLSMDLSEIRAQLKGNQGFSRIYHIRDREGRPLIKRYTFFHEGGLLWLFISDVTTCFYEADRHLGNIQDALRLADSELTERSSLLNLLSRNIRMPLYSIMGLSRIAEDTAEDREALDAYLRKISLSGAHLNETIDDVLDLQRIADRELTLSSDQFRMQSFLSNILLLMQTMCRDRGYIFSSDIELVSDLDILADMHALQQVLGKLLTCILHYAVRGSRINLRVRETASPTDQLTYEFFMECYGLMIDKEKLETLIRPGDRLKNTIESNIGSLDIALVILRSYISAMGAETIIAESDEIHGTRICVTLSFPVAPFSRKREQELLEQTLPKLRGLRILVVDDNDINREVEEKLLDSKGVETVPAENGKEAVDIFRRENGRFDLILMDILMPLMDGRQATRVIREMSDIPGHDSVPIIAMTVAAFREDFEESLQAGMDAHLVKPIRPERLFAVISEVIEDRAARGAHPEAV